MPEGWRGGEDHGDVKRMNRRFSGAKSKVAPVVELRNVNEENERQRIWNLHALIEGLESPEKRVIVGNHRDAWCFGAVNPGSGSAVMMEVISIFNQLRLRGWRPLRTIEFASWDAKEFNLIGSTEFVEDNIIYLRQNGVAYLNVGAGVSGSSFHASASPVLDRFVTRVLKRVSDPKTNSTVKEVWDREKTTLGTLAADGDYVAFQDMAGMSSLDFGFTGAANSYPDHSCYDSFNWMKTFGDPDFSQHHALAQIWALMILGLADEQLIPIDLSAYPRWMDFHARRLQQHAERQWSRAHDAAKTNPKALTKATGFNIQPLHDAIAAVTEQVRQFHAFEETWTAHVFGAQGETIGLEPPDMALKRLDYNERLTHFETHLLDLPTTQNPKHPSPSSEGDESDAPESRQFGVPRREQYRHMLTGPPAAGLFEGDGIDAVFPAVRDALDRGDWDEAERMVRRVARVVRRAGDALVG